MGESPPLRCRRAKLSDADYRSERGAFFGSVHRTLNHLLVSDRIWMRRFTGDGPTYTASMLSRTRIATLRRDREAEDKRIIGWID